MQGTLFRLLGVSDLPRLGSRAIWGSEFAECKGLRPYG